MTRQWIMAVISIITLSVIIIAIDALLVGGYILVTGGDANFSYTLSNVLFVEGGLILLAGAFIEFFHVLGRDNSMIVVPKVLTAGRKAQDSSGTTVEVKNPGWLIILIGGLLIICSVVILFIL
jgi:hypothetical protein